MSTPFPTGTILGYPRIGRRRELKKAVESFWAQKISAAELGSIASDLRSTTRNRLAALGLGTADSSIPEAFSFYDQVLDAAVTVGAIPSRFEHLLKGEGELDLAGYFAVARGDAKTAPLEMTKWFDSNYHYLVPEIGPETQFRLSSKRLIREFAEAVSAGYLTRPVLVGPVTFLLLSKPSEAAPEGFQPLDRLDDLLSVYAELLSELSTAGAEWVQLDEPALVSESVVVPRPTVLAALTKSLKRLAEVPARPQIFLAAPYGDLEDALGVILDSPIDAVGLDLVRGSVPTGFKTGKTLVGGVIDGHNIWRGDLDLAFTKLEALRELSDDVAASTSTNLFHVPHDVEDESSLSEELVGWLAFADQKVGQIVTLARGLEFGRADISAELDEARRALEARHAATGVRNPVVRERVAGLLPEDYERGSYEARRREQAESLQLPPLPITTIGSFPQTGDIRKARAGFARGELSQQEYTEAMREEIRRVVELQEDIGLDVIVHGEPERNDMVQYFAEQLNGFAVTENGWVQSYGTRCTRPSILWGDVWRTSPITVEWSRYTRSLTAKPVKGMLTGPVTILAWSFVRDDQPLRDTANQVALALRDEIRDLEAAGIPIIQVDEPALRELLPLKNRDHADYLDWSVGSFRLATSGVTDRTQIHTHLCYSEFGVVIDAIDRLDADVTSIEAARSRMEVVADIAGSGFSRGIGPGVYDIHSPRIPSVDEISELIDTARGSIPDHQIWINPDCGLKTRGYDETVASLEHIVSATRRARQNLTA